jgi:hypothetical protein
MTAHAKAETLSAYLDERLVGEEARDLEAHIAECEVCHSRLDGMRNVVAGLRNLERLSPPSTLDQMVARRIALSGEHKTLFDRLEEGLSGFQRQSFILSMFCVVIALVLIVYFFLTAVIKQQNATIPVVFEAPPSGEVASPEGQVLQRQGDRWVTVGEEGSRLKVSGMVLVRRGDRWVEEGIDPEAEARVVEWTSEEGQELLLDRPWLGHLPVLDLPVVFEIDGEVLEGR